LAVQTTALASRHFTPLTATGRRLGRAATAVDAAQTGPTAARAAATRRIRIVIVEEYPVVRAALRDMVGRAPDFSIAAEVADIDASIELLRANPADVVLVNTRLAVVNVVEALQKLRRECPSSPIVLVGHGRSDDEVFRALQAGAAAYLSDSVRPAELLNTIRGVAAGEYLIDASVAARPAVARRVLDAFRDVSVFRQLPDPDLPGPSFEQLSDREAEILAKIGEGMSNKDIAAALSISPNTVKNHVKGVMRKLAVNNRTQAVLLALGQAWIRLPDRQSRRPD
jgi:two-component system response regulator DegU